MISDFNNPYDESEFNQLKMDIKSAEMLPEDFIDVFDEINPITNMSGIIYDGFIEESNRACPCFYVARMSFIFGHSRMKSNTYIMAWKLEKDFTQKQCLSYFARIYDYMNQNTGIDQASEFYFKKHITDLNEEEMSVLTLVMRNSSLYNPLRNMHGIKARLKELKN